MLKYNIQYISGEQGQVICKEISVEAPLVIFINDEGLATLIVPLEHVAYIKLNEG